MRDTEHQKQTGCGTLPGWARRTSAGSAPLEGSGGREAGGPDEYNDGGTFPRHHRDLRQVADATLRQHDQGDNGGGTDPVAIGAAHPIARSGRPFASVRKGHGRSRARGRPFAARCKRSPERPVAASCKRSPVNRGSRADCRIIPLVKPAGVKGRACRCTEARGAGEAPSGEGG